MFVTVLMSVHNGAPTLRQALESVLRQTYADLELLVVDDGSTDDSGGILQDMAGRDRRVRVFRQERAGMGAALNTGLQAAMGNWVARMDADDVMLPARLERQIAFVRVHPGLGVAGCLAYYINTHGQRIGRSYSDLRTEEDLRAHLESNRPIGLSHPTAIMRRDVVLEVGGYRPRFWPAEDVDLWTRVAERGWSVLVQQEYLMEYRIHAASVSVADARQARRMYRWVRECMARRRAGMFEPTLEEFSSFERGQPLLKRLNRERRELSKVLYKRAAFAYSSGALPAATARLLAATLLAPAYPVRQVARKLRMHRVEERRTPC
jgi:glycosyltransferase involved in cell wall biosynthesis